ncbi:late expression factor 6 [Phthorimaea operculella granulovirus]|uniref:Late expression factor 6 n=1 Tax=Phthorimaea operculella granulovirus TaxID=192584 RepID=Q8JRY7_9BBAC|nr:late expression factor 6 [Phthorimaea operculella granulovirus]AAM70270.1 late expression factor 6 [Phthorimaea operculella granulovirus]ANY57461.1 late expression factor 6 [Phthorimaea operculella granulovirus]QBH65907.1 late expression factor 6 [Phthorimaea operculella granulovirus]QBH66037.1 late expression factor 6 [Phthorimaea operculella granulovirus]QBH66167.1 late expression factor 6 [Phthorimaea operculella granulovirus]
MFSYTVLKLTHQNYPLYLTKTLMTYAYGPELVKNVDWNRSTHIKLYIKRKSALNKIRNMSFYYPDGTVFSVDTDEEETFEDDGVTPQDFWYDDY